MRTDRAVALAGDSSTMRSERTANARILHVATRYMRGGSERRIRDIVRSYPSGWHHLVIGRDSDPSLAEREVRPDAITLLPTLVREPHPSFDARALLKLLRIIRRVPYDLIVTHQSKAGALGRLAARWTDRRPTIHSLSMADFGAGYPGWQARVFRTVERRLAGSTAAYAVVGHDLARRFESIGVPRWKLNVIRSGVALPHVARAAARAALSRRLEVAERPIALYVGSLELRKNVLQLEPFLSSLRAQLSDPRIRPFLAIAGEGPLAWELSWKLQARHRSTDYRFLGFVPDAPSTIAGADVVVLFSEVEGVPQVLVQAAAAGVPFVAYPADGVRELIEMGARGVIVEDPQAAAVAAARLIRTDADGPGVIDLSSWEPTVIHDAYRSLIETTISSTVGQRPSGR